MATGKGSDPFKRNKTRYRGVTYRVRADGSKTYSVYFQGSHLAVEGGEREALARQAELRGKAARGETPVVPSKVTFAVVAEQWIESKRHLRPYTRRNYRAYLDRILLPKFGKMKIAAITPEHVAGLAARAREAGSLGGDDHGLYEAALRDTGVRVAPRADRHESLQRVDPR